MPAITPMGTAARDAIRMISPLPTIALATPPPSMPTGIGNFVKNAQWSAFAPRVTTNTTMSASTVAARPAHNAATTDMKALQKRRTSSDFSIALASHTPADAPHQKPRDDVDDQADDEEHQSDLDQHRDVDFAGRF